MFAKREGHRPHQDSGRLCASRTRLDDHAGDLNGSSPVRSDRRRARVALPDSITPNLVSPYFLGGRVTTLPAQTRQIGNCAHMSYLTASAAEKCPMLLGSFFFSVLFLSLFKLLILCPYLSLHLQGFFRRVYLLDD